MKWTKDPVTAMKRLASVLGWNVQSFGRVWVITNLPCAEGLSYKAVSALCFMTRVAMASKENGGLALSKEDVREKTRFRPEHMLDRNLRHVLELPASIAGVDETTLYQAYFNPDYLRGLALL